MGAFVVLRGLAFIGDAVSHAAFPGLVIAYLLGLPLYLGGASRRSGPRWRSASSPVAARSASIPRSASCSPGCSRSAILLFSTIKGYVADLFGYLLGNVLGITFVDIVQIAFLGGVVLVVVAILRKELLYASFDPAGAAASGLPVERLDYLLLGLIGVTIVVSIQAVGIIMVVAMLVTPAATGQLARSRFWDLVKVAIGVRRRRLGRRALRQLLPQRRVGRLDRARRDAAVHGRAAVLAEVRLAAPASPPDDERSHRRADTGHLNPRRCSRRLGGSGYRTPQRPGSCGCHHRCSRSCGRTRAGSARIRTGPWAAAGRAARRS